MTIRCHSDSDSAEAVLAQGIKDRESIKLKYFRLRKAVRAKREAELKELKHEEFLERFFLPPLEFPESRWNLYD